MSEIDKFNTVWDGHFHKSKLGHKGYSRRGRQTKERYENILFSIWKHHNDWDEKNGFQIKCYRESAIYRVVNLAVDAGLLIKTRNYHVGDHTNEYHKNQKLFDLVFRGKYNQYGDWLNKVKIDDSSDIISNLLKSQFNNLNKLNNRYNKPYVITKPKNKRLENRIKNLPYDLKKLYKISDKLLDRYYRFLLRLNKAVIHDDLKFFTFVHYDNNGLPTGRPYSYFCSTGNDNKKHKDTSIELRKDFLKRIGLGDYFEVYDIKSEVPRLNWLFHTGEWKNDNYDFYTEIIKYAGLYDKIFIEDIYISRGENKFNHYNDSMKQLFMRIYFGKGSDKQSYNGYIQEIKERNKRNNLLDKQGKLSDLDLIDIMNKNKDTISFKIWERLCNSTRTICGAPIGNLIFWFTFFLETEVKIELLQRGKKVYNVYDGFYYNKDIKDEIRKLIKEKANYIYINYMKLIK